jgi:DNA-binding HxlR family transcriptional regulator
MPKTSAAKSARRSSCPIACTLDVLGDRWTLLLIRDFALGKSRYGEFAGSAEGIPTNILADRLERLETAGIIASETYQENPPRYAYTLTKKGQDLLPILGAVARWGVRHLPGVKLHPEFASRLG